MDQLPYSCVTALALTLVVGFATGDEHREIVASPQPSHLTDAITPQRRVAGYVHLPIRFEPNVGQAPSQIEYLARGTHYAVAITERGAILSLRQGDLPQNGVKRTSHARTPLTSGPAVRVRLSLVHAEAKPQLRAERPQNSVSNYFIGNDPSKWHSNVANYAAVRYEQMYPGVDWVIYGNPQQLEYDFVVAPRANPKQIRLRVDGADRLSVDNHGDLLVHAGKHTLRQLKPVIYQTGADGKRIDIDGHYVIEQRRVSFAVGDYDHDLQLTIDPILVYSTYFGGTNSDRASAITVDGSGNAFVAGFTASTDFPLSTPFQSSLSGNGDAFVSKFSANGNELVYSTYLGGNFTSAATAIAVDNDGEVDVAGYTFSTNFPTANAIQGSKQGYGDAFVTKINAAGNALVYSTYLGGSNCVIFQVGALPGCGSTQANAIAVDGTGNAYIAGYTTSYDFPTANPFQNTNKSNYTAFVTKLNSAGTSLVYSTYLGGSAVDYATAIAVDSEGSAYVAGRAASIDFPTASPFQSTLQGEVSAFVTKLDPDGNALVYSTYLGGSASSTIPGSSGAGAGVTVANAIAVDGAGDAYITGSTSSSNFPTVNPYQATNHAPDGDTPAGDFAGATDAFVSKLNTDGSALVYSTYLGGSSGGDVANAIAVDAAGRAVVAGTTYSTDFPTADPLQAVNKGATHNTGNAFVSEFSADGSVLGFSTYLGGSGSAPGPCPMLTIGAGSSDVCYESGDSASAVAVDGVGNIYIAGATGSVDFPIVNPFQDANRGYAANGTNAFVTKIATAQVTAVNPSQSGGGGTTGWDVTAILGLALAIRRRTLELNAP
jgi:Beta-propeller repeat